MEYAVIIALLSLVVSAITLYLTLLRPPHIQCAIGPTIMAYCGNPQENEKDSLTLYIPVSFINKGSRTGFVYRTAVTIHRKDSPHQRFFMQGTAFWSLHQDISTWGWDEFAHELPLKGNATMAKWISYSWELMPELNFTEGVYSIVFHYWDSKQKPPKHLTHAFIVDKEIIEKLERVRRGESKQLVGILLDKEMEINRLMTEHESKKLLGY